MNLHFVDGEPTAENPDPTLQLGHNKKTRASKCPPPTPRDNSLVVRSVKRAKLDTCSDEIPVPVLDHSADNRACDGFELLDPEPSTSISDCVDIDRASVIHDHCYVYGWYEMNENSNFYMNSLEPYDAVMADRGFTIAEDLLLHRADLFIPPGKRGQEQFTKVDVQKTKTVANLRIFVEQAIRRLKTFRIIKNELPISLIGNLDNIISLCCIMQFVQASLQVTRFWGGSRYRVKCVIQEKIHTPTMEGSGKFPGGGGQFAACFLGDRHP